MWKSSKYIYTQSSFVLGFLKGFKRFFQSWHPSISKREKKRNRTEWKKKKKTKIAKMKKHGTIGKESENRNSRVSSVTPSTVRAVPCSIIAPPFTISISTRLEQFLNWISMLPSSSSTSFALRWAYRFLFFYAFSLSTHFHNWIRIFRNARNTLFLRTLSFNLNFVRNHKIWWFRLWLFGEHF